MNRYSNIFISCSYFSIKPGIERGLLMVMAIVIVNGLEAAEPLLAPPLIEVPFLSRPPSITAVADDSAWLAAAHIPEFVAARLDTGEVDPDPLHPTEAWIGWDSAAIYFRFRCQGGDAWNPATKHDDKVHKGDCVEIFLDAIGDGMAIAEIQCSPQGVIFDQQILCTAPLRLQSDGRLEWSMFHNLWFMTEWNCEELRTKAQIIGGVWIADIAIPAKALLSRLGSDRLSPMTIRANLARHDWQLTPDGERNFVPSYWSQILKGCPHFSHGRMGFLRLVP